MGDGEGSRLPSGGGGEGPSSQLLSRTHAMWAAENERDGGLVRLEMRAAVWETCRGRRQVQGGADPTLMVAWDCTDPVSQLGFFSVSLQQLHVELPHLGAARVPLLGGRAQRGCAEVSSFHRGVQAQWGGKCGLGGPGGRVLAVRGTGDSRRETAPSSQGQELKSRF